MTNRRDFMKLTALGGGVVFLSGLTMPGLGYAKARLAGKSAAAEDFFFIQLSDTHWGYQGPANPEAANTLKKTVDAVNDLEQTPDFIIFTGDLTHTTDDPAERRRRMTEFKAIVAGLKVRELHFIPGEHDASLDNGAAFKEMFGPTHYSFDHKGTHFVTLDNVSDPGASIGDEQLAWLAADLAKQARDARIVVFTHRPLFDLVPKWDWTTRDGAKAIDVLLPYPNVVVFYGHIHQENHYMTQHIPHHSAKSLIFPLPAPGSQDKRTPLPWDSTAPFKGLGFREVEAQAAPIAYKVAEYPVVKA